MRGMRALADMMNLFTYFIYNILMLGAMQSWTGWLDDKSNQMENEN